MRYRLVAPSCVGRRSSSTGGRLTTPPTRTCPSRDPRLQLTIKQRGGCTRDPFRVRASTSRHSCVYSKRSGSGCTAASLTATQSHAQGCSTERGHSGYARGHSRWLYLCDPGGDERITWEALRATMKGRLSVIYVDDATHAGPRPDRLVEWRGRSLTERWAGREGGTGYVIKLTTFESSPTRSTRYCEAVRRHGEGLARTTRTGSRNQATSHGPSGR